MDTGHQKHTGNFEQKEFHFSPIFRQTVQPRGMADGKAGGEPDRPFHHDHSPRSESRDAIPFYFKRNLPVLTTVDADRRQQHARTLIEKDIDVRFASARKIVSVSLEFYVRGPTSWEAYARLAFQP